MNTQEQQTKVTRRDMLTKMATLGLSLTGLSRLACAAPKGAKWNDKFELVVDVELDQPKGTRYRRPYVAIWIEDKDTMSVRTLSLWVQTSNPGPRWFPDLKRWFRDEQERKAIEGGDLIASASSATRMPGKYSVTWNGRNDRGKPVAQGNYTLCIEVAREHGTYQIIRTDINIGATPFKKELDGNVEVKGASVAYRKRK